ncbi:hypothetical protein [Lactobacillus psittaci]|uniref:N-acetyltransferase domain-containing protein n=1 Tax=Lactobacillus psittaci DSM 15354 TaxID=1122152 RepID=A0A0R1S3M1_9LACO|nr:hypothetical protein [Lactobacillus psittaci]KRL63134.1 hypothetical protein FC23_GL001073 [Lactobacillus psittaci DSM 15354]
MFVHDKLAHNFYEDSQIGAPNYRLHYHLIKNDKVMAIDHVFVNPEIKNPNTDKLIETAISWAKEHKLMIMPLGPTILAYFQENETKLAKIWYKKQTNE